MQTHDEVVQQALEAVGQLDRAEIVAAFVGSLSTKNLAARSAFGSYVILQHLTDHEFQDSGTFSMGHCAVCGVRPETRTTEEGRNNKIAKYPFQVQHTQLVYSTHDLRTFPDRERNEPTAEDIRLLNEILAALRALPESAQLSELVKAPQGIIKSNKHQRTILLETFGYAGILCPEYREHYGRRFVPFDEAESQQPANSNKRDWAYPARFWMGENGVQEEWVRYWFGDYLSGN